MTLSARHISLVLILISIVVYAVGVQTLWVHSHYWPNSGLRALPFKYLVINVLLAIAAGAMIGMLIGSALRAGCKLFGRPDLKPIRWSLFISLNVMAIIWLWMMPKLS